MAKLDIKGRARQYFVVTVVFFFAAAAVHAQTTNTTLYTYKQRKLNDTLQALFSGIQPVSPIPVRDAMPVLRLENEDVNVGSSHLGEIYSMKVDNMPCLKPFEPIDDIPNAMKVKPVLPAMPKEKQ